jgi:hypothetical protein
MPERDSRFAILLAIPLDEDAGLLRRSPPLSIGDEEADMRQETDSGNPLDPARDPLLVLLD